MPIIPPHATQFDFVDVMQDALRNYWHTQAWVGLHFRPTYMGGNPESIAHFTAFNVYWRQHANDHRNVQVRLYSSTLQFYLSLDDGTPDKLGESVPFFLHKEPEENLQKAVDRIIDFLAPAQRPAFDHAAKSGLSQLRAAYEFPARSTPRG